MSLSRLWEEYSKTRSSEIRNEIAKEYINFVGFLVGRVISELPPGIEKDDLVQFGVCGLIDAIDKYDPKLGAKFETYASKRIMGAIVDQIRYYGKTSGGMSRTARVKMKAIEEATKKLEQQLSRRPSSDEVAKELGIGVNEYQKMLGEITYMSPTSLDSLVGEEENLSMTQVIKNEKSAIPEEEYELKENNELLAEAIDELPEKEKMIVIYYYYDEMTLKEIGERLHLSESRISQLHTKAMSRLRNKLTGGD